MPSILVCHSYFLRLDQKQWARAKPYPPLATLRLVTLLRTAGYSVHFFDAMLAGGVDEYATVFRAVRPDVVVLYEDTFNFLSKMCLSTMRRAACEMISIARLAAARVIVAGPDVSDAPGPYLKSGADVALKGEGLVSLLDMLPRLTAYINTPVASLVEGVTGVATLVGGKVMSVGGGKILPVRQDAGHAAWDVVDMPRYRAVWLDAHGYFSLNMAASRGCSFRCAWCAKPIWGNRFLQRDAREVAAEMTHLKRRFNPDHIWFADDIFGFRVDWITEFGTAAAEAGGSIPFTVQTRADLISEPMALALRRAGCREAWLGAESGSQRVLDAMNKGTTVAQIVTARKRLDAAHIRVGFFIQLGYLEEQFEDILATRDLIERAQPDEIGVSVSYPLPGTKFHELVKAQLGSKTHWQESNDLAMMFKGTYTSDFYRKVRNLLHEQVRLQSADSRSGHTAWNGAQRALDQRWALLSPAG